MKNKTQTPPSADWIPDSNAAELKDLKDSYFQTGFLGFVILALASSVLKRIFDYVWVDRAHLLLGAAYIVFLLYVIYNNKYKPLFLASKKTQLFIILILPAIATCVLSYLLFLILDSFVPVITSKPIDINALFANGGSTFIVVLLVTLSFAGCGILYMQDKNLNRIKESVKEKNNSSKLAQLCRNVDDLKTQLSQNSDDLKTMIENRTAVAYAATCIPIRFANDKNGNPIGLYFCLIENHSYTKSAWMFPGGHIDIHKNNAGSGKELSSIEITPINVVKAKAKNEAGITDLELIDPNSPQDYEYSKTYLPIVSPVFNHFFQISENARCFKEKGHECHYDFTYVGKYTTIHDNEYKCIEVLFEFKNYNFEESKRDRTVNDMTLHLAKRINEYMKSQSARGRWNTIPSNDLFYGSIPEMIYSTMKLFMNTPA